MAIPCYVSGKGMYAAIPTRQFKVEVIQALEQTGLGYDTRYRYYQRQFPDMDPLSLAQMICDPIEYYDRDWATACAALGRTQPDDNAITAFMLTRDAQFRRDAHAAIYCYDEAGFGSGINTMRFLQSGTPILGFYNDAAKRQGMNIHNILQLRIDFPELITLICYHHLDEIRQPLMTWIETLNERSQRHGQA